MRAEGTDGRRRPIADRWSEGAPGTWKPGGLPPHHPASSAGFQVSSRSLRRSLPPSQGGNAEPARLSPALRLVACCLASMQRSRSLVDCSLGHFRNDHALPI